MNDFQTSRVPFRRKWEYNPEGNNLVVNRKSLNVESNRRVEKHIREGNLQFLKKI
jgi:hypothetical protein